MSLRFIGRLVLACAALVATPLACVGEPYSVAGGDGAGGPGEDEQPEAEQPICEGPMGPAVDPTTLPACCPEHGDSHCVDNAGTLDNFAGPCEGGGHCVPDAFIATGGVFQPLACESIGGAAGVCLSQCAPKVAENAALLPQDVCAESEKCVPCISPLDGSETGACNLGFSCDEDADPGPGSEDIPCPHEGPPVVDPSDYPPCPSCGGGRCVAKGSVPPEQQAQLAECDSDSLCVPDEAIETGGRFIPESCDSINDAEGRCLSTCLPEVAAQQGTLPKGGCPSDHLCVPCFSPFDGSDTGACDLGCDPGPVEGASLLPDCCNGIGTCVPDEIIPPEQLSMLGNDSCSQVGGPMACVPDVFLEPSYKPTYCETSWISFLLGSSYKPGACMPKCLPNLGGLVNNIVLKQDGCPAEMKCAPCKKPFSSDQTGACDGMGCDGFCGSQSPEGCWCDPQCVEMGDCCADACTECSTCTP